MKHEKEIDDLLRDIFYEEWMSQEEYEEIESKVFDETGITKQTLSDNIEVGIKNGHSVQFQIDLIKIIFDEL